MSAPDDGYEITRVTATQTAQSWPSDYDTGPQRLKLQQQPVKKRPKSEETMSVEAWGSQYDVVERPPSTVDESTKPWSVDYETTPVEWGSHYSNATSA